MYKATINKALLAVLILGSTGAMAEQLICKKITNVDLSIPNNVIGYTTGEIDVSSKFNFPDGSIFVKATKANTFDSGNFRVNPTHHMTFDIDGNVPVYIKAKHGGILEAGKKDKIFIGQNSGSYKLISTLRHGLTQGENRNPGYYVKNITKRKISNSDFVWMSKEPETHISFGTSADGKFNSRVGLELCAPEPEPEPEPEPIICKKITNIDLSIPNNVIGYTTEKIDVSFKFNFPVGSVLVKATKANTFTSGNFRVNPTHHMTFDIDGDIPVYIKAKHGGILEAGKKDKIFIGQNSGSYKLISTLGHGLTHGQNINPGYYVQNITKRKIFNSDFVWMSTEPETHISFGTNAGGKFNSRVGLELCAPELNPRP